MIPLDRPDLAIKHLLSLIEAQDKLLAAYRTQSRPSETVFKALERRAVVLRDAREIMEIFAKRRPS